MKGVGSLGLLLILLLAGCVSQTTDQREHDPSLMIAQNSDGETTLVWESDSSYIYTVFYMDADKENWKALRGANRVRGTGKTLEAKDRVNPNKPQRRYRLGFEKQGY
jgi:predicted glycosyl hydrolase (DUF1957 family)